MTSRPGRADALRSPSRGRRERGMQDKQRRIFDAATSLPADRIIGMLSWSNTCLALAVVFDMVSKPTLIPALGILVVGVLVGLSVAAATEAKAVTAEEPAASVQGDPAG